MTEALKKLIWFDTIEYTKYLKLQNELKEVFAELKKLHNDILGYEIQNYEDYLSNAGAYIITKWFKANAHLFPANTIPEQAFKIQTIDIVDVERLCQRFNQIQRELKIHRATITTNSISYTLNEEVFNHYLDETKKDHYDALDRLIKTLAHLETFEAIDRIGIIRTSSNLMFDETSNIKILESNFY